MLQALLLDIAAAPPQKVFSLQCVPSIGRCVQRHTHAMRNAVLTLSFGDFVKHVNIDCGCVVNAAHDAPWVAQRHRVLCVSHQNL
jgi:hypothetical protein